MDSRVSPILVVWESPKIFRMVTCQVGNPWYIKIVLFGPFCHFEFAPAGPLRF